jgi:hypothetical protein
MSIKNYVDVGISIEAARLAQLGFNKVLILAESDTLDRAKVISTSDYDDDDLGGTESELYKAFMSYLSQPLIAPEVIVGCKKSTDATYAAAISAIRAENDNWYGVVTVSRVKDDILAVSAVAETLSPGRLHFAVTSDAAVPAKTASNVAEEIAEAGYYRTALIYSTDTDAYANAAQAAYLSYNPGSFTFNFKELRGVKAETLTAQERTNLIDQKCQVQIEVAGLKRIFDGGMVGSGEWIDIMHGIDWLTARISEGVFAILASAPKVPMTNSGVALLGTEMIRNLVNASSDPFNFIRDDFTTFLPDVNSLSAVDRAARKLPGLRFTAHPQGAVHFVEIRGKLII